MKKAEPIVIFVHEGGGKGGKVKTEILGGNHFGGGRLQITKPKQSPLRDLPPIQTAFIARENCYPRGKTGCWKRQEKGIRVKRIGARPEEASR